MTALTKHEGGGQVSAVSETAAILSVIERAALNPDVDIDKMERLLQMQERIIARNAEAAYNEALAAMQPNLPEVEQHGFNDHTKKHYARWEDIHEAIAPVLATHGFALTFRTAEVNGKVTVTAILRHKEGHKDETSLPLPTDTGAGRNAVQAVGSSLSYGKRYTACALLNIRSRGDDDDGAKATKRSSARVPGGGSMRDASRDTIEAAERGEEGSKLKDYSTEPEWAALRAEMEGNCQTRPEVTAWWKNKKVALTKRQPHFARAFNNQVVLPYWDSLPEVVWQDEAGARG